jgi:hypothetical protein
MQPQSITFTCLMCDLPFMRFPSAVAAGKTKFCSKPCAAAYRASRPLSERIARFTQQTETHWFWTGQTNNQGYGQLRVNSHLMLATHAAWEVATGHAVAPYRVEVVGHVCDTPLCIRTDDEGVYTIAGVDWPRRGHLYLATQKANMEDMAAKGRASNPALSHPELMAHGVAHHNAKLNPDIVRWMRVRHAEGGITYAQLGALVGISTMQAYDIVNLKAWRHVV